MDWKSRIEIPSRALSIPGDVDGAAVKLCREEKNVVVFHMGVSNPLALNANVSPIQK